MKFEQKETELTRRCFLGLGALATGAAVGGGILAGCAPQNGQTAGGGQGNDSGGAINTAASIEPGGKWDFENPPVPVDASQITENLQADIVIVGAGIAGTIAAFTAAHEGASVLVLQKNEAPMTHGIGMCSFGIKARADAGIDDDYVVAGSQLAAEGNGKVDQSLVRNFMKYNGEAIDFVSSTIAKERPDLGEMVSEVPGDDTFIIYGWKDENYADKYFRCNNMINKLRITNEEDFGVQYCFETVGEQLEKDAQGKIVAVIAKGPDGYIRASANKGIILATGDIGNNPAMVAKYQPQDVGTVNTYVPATNTGDGHRMGMWVGAQMERAPYTQMIHYDPNIYKGEAPFANNPYLALNKRGIRYQNEDLGFTIIANTNVLQPEGLRFQVFDADYLKYWDKFGPAAFNGVSDFRNFPGFSFNTIEEAEEACLKSGAFVKADTLEELAVAVGIDTKTFVETCLRYQKFVEQGRDEDFGKNPEHLAITPVKTPPFYVAPRRANTLVVLGGLVTTPDLRVLDTQDNPIEGLWCAGNVVGKMFGYDYTLSYAGISVARAVTTGYMSAKSVLGTLE
jgi:fumarate reductase flavoprotein subunit